MEALLLSLTSSPLTSSVLVRNYQKICFVTRSFQGSYNLPQWGECTTALGILLAIFFETPCKFDLTPFVSRSMPSWWQVAYVTNVSLASVCLCCTGQQARRCSLNVGKNTDSSTIDLLHFTWRNCSYFLSAATLRWSEDKSLFLSISPKKYSPVAC